MATVVTLRYGISPYNTGESIPASDELAKSLAGQGLATFSGCPAAIPQRSPLAALILRATAAIALEKDS